LRRRSCRKSSACSLRDPVQATIFDVCLAQPVGQRCRGNTEIGSDFVSWFFAIPGNFYYVTAELFRECSHDNNLPGTPSGVHMLDVTKPCNTPIRKPSIAKYAKDSTRQTYRFHLRLCVVWRGDSRQCVSKNPVLLGHRRSRGCPAIAGFFVLFYSREKIFCLSNAHFARIEKPQPPQLIHSPFG